MNKTQCSDFLLNKLNMNKEKSEYIRFLCDFMGIVR